MIYDLKVQRVFDATPEDVFDAFTDPDAQKEWYQLDPDWTVETECDVRVGGVWKSRGDLREASRIARGLCSRWSTGATRPATRSA